jgi:hypothetical protein
MTPDLIRAYALQAAIAFASANNNNPTMAQVASAYNFFVNLINIAQLRDNVQTFPTQLPRELPQRPVADLSSYRANVNGG